MCCSRLVLRRRAGKKKMEKGLWSCQRYYPIFSTAGLESETFSFIIIFNILGFKTANPYKKSNKHNKNYIKKNKTKPQKAADCKVWTWWRADAVCVFRGPRPKCCSVCSTSTKTDNTAFSQQCLMDFLWLCLVIAWPLAPWPLCGSWQTDQKHAALPIWCKGA